VKKMDPAT
jgi:hypothetical protein